MEAVNSQTCREFLQREFPFLRLREESTPLENDERIVFSKPEGQKISRAEVFGAVARCFAPKGFTTSHETEIGGRLVSAISAGGTLAVTITICPRRVLVSISKYGYGRAPATA